MKRVITSLSLLLLLLCEATAQSISQYEYWTDDDYANRKMSRATGNDVSLSVSTATLEAGIHFLNFRACRDDGVWGNFYRYLYYIPTLKAAASGDVKVEYWLDDKLSGMKSKTTNEGNLSLTIDVSAMPPGVHYFNCTPVASTGERGNSERYLFYVPQSFDLAKTSPVKGFEYWIDDNYSSKKIEQSGLLNPMLTISIGGLISGVHYFNCRVFNERGEYGNPVREMFYIPEAKSFSDAKLASYEYWIDDDYAHCVRGSSANANQAFTIDVSQLSSGVHYFNYWPIDDNGRRGNVTRQMFYIAKIVDYSISEEIEYEYWIDSDTGHKVTGKGTIGNYVFNIDISELEKGKHTFNFRAKNQLDQWGETFVESFDISEEPVQEIIIAAQNVTMTYGDDVPELKYTVIGGQLKGEPRLATTATKTSPVGTYPITIEKGTVTNGNVKLVSGNLTITRAPLVITVADAEMTEGKDLPQFELSYEGFKNGETESIFIKEPIVTTTANSASEPGVYDIIVSGAEARNYEITYVSGKLIVNQKKVNYGDADGDGVIDVSDLVIMINHIMNSDLPYEECLDMNHDGEINVADVILIKRIILFGTLSREVKTRSYEDCRVNCNLSELTAIQFDVTVPDKSEMENMVLLGMNQLTHQIEYEKNGECSYRVIIYSMCNQPFTPVNGCLLALNHIDDITNLLFVKPSGERAELNTLPPFILTGIESVSVDENATSDIYDMSGVKVRSAGDSLKGMKRGVYIMNGKKIAVR